MQVGPQLESSGAADRITLTTVSALNLASYVTNPCLRLAPFTSALRGPRAQDTFESGSWCAAAPPV